MVDPIAERVLQLRVVTIFLAILWCVVPGCKDSGSVSQPDAAAGEDADAGNDGEDNDAGNDGGDDIAGLVSIEDLRYLGAFRFSSDEFGVSSTNYAIGTLAYNPANHSLFIAGHDHHRAVAEFEVPEPGTGDEVTALPVVASPLQVFSSVLDRSPNGNPEEIDRITGMLWAEGQLLVNAETWYDAPGDNADTTLVVRDANDLGGSVDGYFELSGAARAGGYMAPVPAGWQDALGGTHLTGWSSVYSIVGRYSVGPTLWIFDPHDILDAPAGAEGPVEARPLMDFSYQTGAYLDPDALVAQEGSASALWNFLSRGVYGFIIPGTRTFAVFGSSGGVDSGIGYKITQDDGNLCGGYCSYAADDNYNYYWFYDLEEILAANEVHEPRPYAYGRWSVPFDDGGKHPIIGGAFNPDDNVLYLALGGAGQVGEYDRPPLIVAYGVGR